MNLEPDTIPGVSHKVRAAGKLRNHGFIAPEIYLFIYFASKAFIYEQRAKVSVKNQTFNSN